MYKDLISLIEGAAPTVAAALVPAPLSIPAGALAAVAIAHLADGLGLPHPADPQDIVNKLGSVSPMIRDSVLSRVESNFQTALAPIATGGGASTAPAAPTTTGSPQLDAVQSGVDVNPNHGVTVDLTSMVIFMVLSVLSGILASRGIHTDGIVQALTGSSDLHIAAAMIAGTLTVAVRHILGTNKNTVAMASASKS